jgi:hypothetical protein
MKREIADGTKFDFARSRCYNSLNLLDQLFMYPYPEYTENGVL